MPGNKNITKWFGENLAKLLADKIKAVYEDFDSTRYFRIVKKESENLSFSKRVKLHADTLRELLPQPYPEAIKILIKILGKENLKETGMFTDFYWIMPLGKFVEQYGLDLEYFEISMNAIQAITKRNTGEYAIRPFIRKYPQATIKIMQKWSKSENFHLRRLSSEGSRPRLPWSVKLDVFIEDPEPVFKILENLIRDDIKFVKKSVANNLRDYLKVNNKLALDFINKYQKSNHKNTQWILKYSTRKIKV